MCFIKRLSCERYSLDKSTIVFSLRICSNTWNEVPKKLLPFVKRLLETHPNPDLHTMKQLATVDNDAVVLLHREPPINQIWYRGVDGSISHLVRPLLVMQTF